jgi:hypothetical protein
MPGRAQRRAATGRRRYGSSEIADQAKPGRAPDRRRLARELGRRDLGVIPSNRGSTVPDFQHGLPLIPVPRLTDGHAISGRKASSRERRQPSKRAG